MKALVRINRVKTAWQFFGVSLEVVDFVTHGEISRGIVSALTHLGDPTRNNPQTPAKIKVKSERGRPLR
jgi:hypothetical protein